MKEQICFLAFTTDLALCCWINVHLYISLKIYKDEVFLFALLYSFLLVTCFSSSYIKYFFITVNTWALQFTSITVLELYELI